jgi:hypothetical protein
VILHLNLEFRKIEAVILEILPRIAPGYWSPLDWFGEAFVMPLQIESIGRSVFFAQILKPRIPQLS